MACWPSLSIVAYQLLRPSHPEEPAPKAPVPAPCLAQTSPPNPIAAEPSDGWVLSRPPSRVHKPCNFTDVVALRPQTALTGSGSHRPSYSGFGGGHPLLPT